MEGDRMKKDNPAVAIFNLWAWLFFEAVLLAMICCEILPRL
jgi:hypothetical protein